MKVIVQKNRVDDLKLAVKFLNKYASQKGNIYYAAYDNDTYRIVSE